MVRRATPVFMYLLVAIGSSTQGNDLTHQGLLATSNRGMVVSVSRPASDVGQQILDAGGNAVDAAVAVGFALSVTWPEAGNIGGGGFMLVHPSDGKPPSVIDYREKAPGAATVEMFATGDESPYLHVGVPGTVRGLKVAHQRFGRLSWENVVRPSVDLARDGFVVSEELAKSLNGIIEKYPNNEELVRVFAQDRGQRKWRSGDRLVQSDLAETLDSIAVNGADAFYTGKIADAITTEMKRGGGLITTADLAAYQAVERVPVHGTYRGYDVFASPPPSSGGTALVQMLNTAEGFVLRREGRWSVRTLHIMIECMRRAYCDRARYLGDPEFNQIPSHLVTKDYASKLKETISTSQATSSATLGADILSPGDRLHTTHFSVIDQAGMAVSNTYTLEDDFGSRIVVRGAGFLLNDEMGDFNPKPGVTDATGLIGTRPNLVAPGKRMLSSMCPVVVSQNGRVVLVTGSPGGRTIINTLFCVVMNVLEFEMPLREAIDAPRMHQQWMPDAVRMEAGLLNGHALEVTKLRGMGHTVDDKPRIQGDAHSIFVEQKSGNRLGVVDPRRSGWAAGQE
jgi:gamma-glutamyltranspeptidase/glutathione hydrolase